MYDCDGPQTAEEHRVANLRWDSRANKRCADEYKNLLVGLITTFRIRGKLEKTDIDGAERIMKSI